MKRAMESTEWQLQDAKNRFSEVVKRAMDGSPQLVTRHGHPAVYVISAEDYTRSQSTSIKDVLLNSPHREIELDIQRTRDSGREVSL